MKNFGEIFENNLFMKIMKKCYKILENVSENLENIAWNFSGNSEKNWVNFEKICRKFWSCELK